MTAERKHREFWIHRTGQSFDFDVISDSPTIHVIEITALDELKQDLESLVKMYGDIDNWSGESAQKCSAFTAGDHESIMCNDYAFRFFAGSLSRQIAAKYKINMNEAENE